MTSADKCRATNKKVNNKKRPTNTNLQKGHFLDSLVLHNNCYEGKGQRKLPFQYFVPNTRLMEDLCKWTDFNSHHPYNFWDILSKQKTIRILPYFGKRKQVTKVTFLVKEQNVSVISTDVNAWNIMMSFLTYLLACRMSVKCIKFAWKKSTLGKRKKTLITQI